MNQRHDNGLLQKLHLFLSDPGKARLAIFFLGLTSTGCGPVILEWVVTGLVCRLGEPMVLCGVVLCWTVRTTWEDAENKNHIASFAPKTVLVRLTSKSRSRSSSSKKLTVCTKLEFVNIIHFYWAIRPIFYSFTSRTT